MKTTRALKEGKQHGEQTSLKFLVLRHPCSVIYASSTVVAGLLDSTHRLEVEW